MLNKQISRLIMVLIALSIPVSAQEKPPTEDHIDSVKTQFELVGKAKFSVLFWDIYTSRLYTHSGRYTPDNQSSPVLFEINYLRDITKKDLIERTIEQWQHIGLTESQYQAYLPLISSIWPDINKGDTLSLLINDTTSTFYYNQQNVGTISLPLFGQQFIDIWLSPKTSQPTLRKQLIGVSPP